MSTLKLIEADWMAARKDRDRVRANLLGTLVGRITTTEKTFNPARPMMETDVVAEVKKMLDGVTETGRVLAQASGREAQRDQNEAEREILLRYMPQQMTEQEIEAFALAKRQENMSLGQIMSALKSEHPGKYDGRIASTIVKRVVG